MKRILALLLALACCFAPVSHAATGGQVTNGKQQFVDQNGAPIVGGQVFIYLPGTTTPVATYQDAYLTTLNTNPVLLDSKGQATIWATPGLYREVVYDSLGNLIWDQTTAAPGGGTASALSPGATISITGDLTYTSPVFTGSANITGAGVLANTGVTAGTYGGTGSIPQLTIDAKGRVTSASSVSLTAATGSGYSNLALDTTAGSKQLTITADEVVVKTTGGAARIISSLSCTVDISSSGAVNKLDTGTAANQTFYYEYAISNGATDGCLASASPTSPTLPSGYTYKKRLGAALTDSSANFLGISQRNEIARYIGASLPALFTGTSGNTSTPTWTAFPVRGNSGAGVYAPTTATTITLQASNFGAAVTIAAPNNSYGGTGSTTNPPPVNLTNSISLTSTFYFESGSIYAASNGGSNGVRVVGWQDNL